jgi:hypothetical protein
LAYFRDAANVEKARTTREASDSSGVGLYESVVAVLADLRKSIVEFADGAVDASRVTQARLDGPNGARVARCLPLRRLEKTHRAVDALLTDDVVVLARTARYAGCLR